MSTKLTILAELRKVAAEQAKALAPLSDDLVLLDSGLDSLCFAVLVARLEDRLGVDPFTASDDVAFPVTLGDFVKVYEHPAGGRRLPPRLSGRPRRSFRTPSAQHRCQRRAERSRARHQPGRPAAGAARPLGLGRHRP